MNPVVKNVIRIASIIVTALLVLFAFYRIQKFQEDYDDEVRFASDQKTELESAINSQNRQLEELRSNVSSLNSEVHSARISGNAVAEIQTSAREDNERLTELSDYFDDTNLFLWLPELEGSYTWEFMTDYEFSANSINVIWICVNTSDEICGYASAKYSTASDIFTNLHVSRIGIETVMTEETTVVEETEVVTENDVTSEIVEDNHEDEYTAVMPGEEETVTEDVVDLSGEGQTTEQSTITEEVIDLGGN